MVERCEEGLFINWQPKANVFATKKYMGLRRDPALFDSQRFAASGIGVIAPRAVEDWGELVGISVTTIDEATRSGMVDAQGELSQEASILLMQEIAKTQHPIVLAAAELTDLVLDIDDVVESLGYRWVP